MSDLRISSISIVDTFGTKHAKFSPGSITRIAGPNGSGKSSILRALGSIFAGGSDPSAIRHGAERSVVEMSLSDGTVITRTTAPKKRRKGAEDEPIQFKTELEITQPDGTPRNAPQSYINELSEAVAVDPGLILRIDATTAPGRKQLAEILMSIMPIRFEPASIEEACRYRSTVDVPRSAPDVVALQAPAVPLDLDGLKKFANQITELRRRTGQTRDDSDGAIKRLEKALPPDDGRDYSAALAEAEEYKASVNQAIYERRMEIEKGKSEVLAEAVAEHNKAASDIDRDIDAQILELERMRAEHKAAAQKTLDGKRAKITEIVAEQLRALTDESKPELEKAAAEIASLKEKLEANRRAETLKQEIEVQLATCRDAGWKYQQLTEVLERIEKLRKDKLDSLPVAGLEVSGDQVLVDGTPWQNANTARKIEVALQLCTLRSGRLGVLFLDDAEHLDRETRALLEQEIARAGFQLIEAIVADSPKLTIETIESAVAA